MIYGYMRVSTKEQNEARQLREMHAQGIPASNLFLDKQSGKDFNRPAYRRMCRKLKRGDLLVVKSIDRLGRDYHEIQEEWKRLTQEKRVDILVLDMPLLNTTIAKDLLGTFISDMVLQLLSFVAENERASIRQRQAEGIAAARARGVHLGRPAHPLPEGFCQAAAQWRAGECTLREALERTGMAKSTFCAKAGRLEQFL